MNPWKPSIPASWRDTQRFALWTIVFINGVLIALFSVRFTYALLTHVWAWLEHRVFTGPENW